MLAAVGGLFMVILFGILFVTLQQAATNQSPVWVWLLRGVPIAQLVLLVVWPGLTLAKNKQTRALNTALALLGCWLMLDFILLVIYGAGAAVI